MKPTYRVAVFGLCLAFGVAFPVRGPLLAAEVAQQPGPKPDSDHGDPSSLPLEFYGYASGRDAAPQRAFLRQGARIIIAAEGDLIEDTYRLVRITADSAVVEDMSNTHRQTLTLAAPKPYNDSAAAQQAPAAARPGTSRNAPAAAKTSRPSEASSVPGSVDPANTLPRPYQRPVRQLSSTQR